MNKKKGFLFVIPPCITPDDLIPNKIEAFSNKIRKEVPLGVLSLATYIERRACVECHILDLNLLFYKLVFEENNSSREAYLKNPSLFIKEQLYEIKNRMGNISFAGISAIFTPTYEWVCLISREIKELDDNICVLAGGGIPTNMPEDLFKDAPALDIISYGEGEIGLYNLVISDDIEKTVFDNPSLTNRRKIKEYGISSLEFQCLENLDDIPPLDFSLIKLREYSSHVHSQRDVETISIPLMFSRGCPFKCCFCASHSVHGRSVRYNSTNRIKSDILMYISKYKINTVTVWDDNFFVDKNQAVELLGFFNEQNLLVEFVNGFPVYRMDDDMAKMLKQSGVDTVTLAIESGSNRVLKEIIHKPLKIEMVPKAVDILRKYDFYIKGLFVIGFPGETKDDIKETMDFIHESRINWVDIYIASPLPGSELYNVCVEKGYLKGDIKSLSFFGRGRIETENFSTEYIENCQIYNMIKKDYVFNQDLKDKKWERALINFEYVINGNHENPFAFYGGALAAKNLNEFEKCKRYYKEYKRILNENISYRNLYNQMISEGIEFPSLL